MSSKSFCSRVRPQRVTSGFAVLAAVVASCLTVAPAAAADEAPQWMHALVSSSLPTYDERVDAVLLYSETDVTVLSADKIRTNVREAYKIIRPNGRGHGTIVVDYSPQKKIKALHGWCIPAQGKDYEVREKDAIDREVDGGAGLVVDTKYKVLKIPAAEPGNIVGYEFELEEQPFFLQDLWHFQENDPVRESHYSLHLPPGWEFKASFLNHAEIKSADSSGNFWRWTVNDVPEIRHEPDMPPLHGVLGQMLITFYPAGGKAPTGFTAWDDMGKWYANLAGTRVDASPEIKQQVATLTAGKNTPAEKMRALADFLQRDVRYVAIELGIGGWQPHPASYVFEHRFGDCKDKATLMRSMLHEIGIESYFVIINTRRGVIDGDSPAHNAFNHAITAIRLPDGLNDPSIVATVQHPKLGKLLYFDPTSEVTPFGQLAGHLQGNFALLVKPDGGELVQLPQEPTSATGIRRTAKLTLSSSGVLTGDVNEMRYGDRASAERMRLMRMSKDMDRIKPIESLLSGSLSSFQITHATILNMEQTQLPFGFKYSFESPNYAKNAGDLLLVRPRVLGSKSSNLLETKDPRKFAIEFDGPSQDTDNFAITIPDGYVVDDMPPPVDADYSFASYHSKTEVKGNVIDYTRTLEVKELSVPVARAEELRKFYRTIASDEKNTVVLKAK